MPEEKRFTWTKQRAREKKPFQYPTWFPVQERWKTPKKPAPTVPQFAPEYPPGGAQAQTIIAQRKATEEFRGGEAWQPWVESIERQNLLNQIYWYEDQLSVKHPLMITEDTSIEELGNYLEALARSYSGRAVGQGQVGRGATEGGLPANVQTLIQEAQSLGIDTTDFENEYANAISERAKGYVLQGFNDEVSRQFQAKRAKESRVLAREFPEQFAKYSEQWQPVGKTYTPPEETFYGWFQSQPEYEKTTRGWETKHYQNYPQLYPWYQEAGGRKTGKTFKEWIPTEPLARAYLGEQRATEAMRRPPQMTKRWQSARQR